MKVDNKNLESLRRLLRHLEKENKYYKDLLESNDIPFSEMPLDERMVDKYDLNQGERIQKAYITEDTVRGFYAYFHGRDDVYARRSKNGGYYPQCKNFWKDVCPKKKNKKYQCKDCFFREWERITKEVILAHLLGNKDDASDVIGIYPLREDNKCRFLVFDFDNHDLDNYENEDWKEEVNALRMICHEVGIDCLVERSRSGNGAHVWIFFNEPILASVARTFGELLLDKGSSSVNLHSFLYYDRMFPTQNDSDDLENLIALPLQGIALKNGNSAFVDENWNAYPDQFGKLFSTRRLSAKEISDYIDDWRNDMAYQTSFNLFSDTTERIKPWRKDNTFHKEDVIGEVHLTLADGIYIDSINLNPRLQNQIRSLAAFDNPIYYKNKNGGFSNYKTPSVLYLGEDTEGGYIHIPRGLLNKLKNKLYESGIEYEIENERNQGKVIDVTFNGALTEEQKPAVEKMLEFNEGILNAATGYGKTVIGCYLIALKKVNTLILVENKSVFREWKEKINTFLTIHEDSPQYVTKSGKTKTRKSAIGGMISGADKTTGIIDVAMIQSVFSNLDHFKRLKEYGMVLIDECHHVAATTYQKVIGSLNAQYIYGLTATVKRSDNLEKIEYMYMGDILYKYSALQRAKSLGYEHIIIPRFTRCVDLGNEVGKDFNKGIELIINDDNRNQLIIEDVKRSIKDKRTPLVLTNRKVHAKYLYDCLKDEADHVYLIYGDNSAKENSESIKRMKETSIHESVMLIATGSMIGEGFDYQRLDTLFIVTPVSYEGTVTQYIGRIDRKYEGKEKVIVYDYIDTHIPVFDKQYRNRLSTYKKLGFHVSENKDSHERMMNAIYDSSNYLEALQRDILESKESVYIVSPFLTSNKVDWLITTSKEILENGINITVITNPSSKIIVGNSNEVERMILLLREEGIVVVEKECSDLHFAVIDKKVVWHGSINLLGIEDSYDSLIRVEDDKAASELLELVA